MQALDIFDEKRHTRQLHVQRRLAWDIEARLDWTGGIDLSKPLLPLDQNNILFPSASPDERLVISQLMGLIVAATISQLEQVALDLKERTWSRVLDQFPINPEFRALGEQFYAEEAKHAAAFSRYIDTFAGALAIAPEDLRSLLPQANRSLYKEIYAWNSVAGGTALWWLVTAVEEESVVIHRYMEPFRDRIDPLYYQLHRAHFEEELRHKSYAQMMLQLLEESGAVKRSLVSRKLDFLLAECLHLTWTFGELVKLRGLRRFKNHHPFFKTLDGLLGILGKRNPLSVLRTLFTSAPYISDSLHLGEHAHVRALLDQYGTLQAPLPQREAKAVCCQ